jgi:hypothetical protein
VKKPARKIPTLCPMPQSDDAPKKKKGMLGRMGRSKNKKDEPKEPAEDKTPVEAGEADGGGVEIDKEAGKEKGKGEEIASWAVLVFFITVALATETQRQDQAIRTFIPTSPSALHILAKRGKRR